MEMLQQQGALPGGGGGGGGRGAGGRATAGPGWDALRNIVATVANAVGPAVAAAAAGPEVPALGPHGAPTTHEHLQSLSMASRLAS
jgi:hypothetical protein